MKKEDMQTLPSQYAELYTANCPPGRCHFIFYVNHRTPSGMDRPWPVQVSKVPLLTGRIITALPPGCTYFLDNVRHTRDNGEVVPYTEKDVQDA